MVTYAGPIDGPETAGRRPAEMNFMEASFDLLDAFLLGFSHALLPLG